MNKHNVATIEDVAQIAGVSIATVSRAIHTPAKVADTTRRKVLEAVAQTGYTANAMARSLRMRRSNMILILAPDVGDPNFSNILVGLETEASKRGYGVLIGNTQNDPAREADYLGFIASNKADGLILLTGHLPFGLAENGGAAKLPPVVAVNEPVRNADVPFVGVDNFAGARIATDYLIAQGHRRIAFIGHSTSKMVSMLREEGYRGSLASAGIAVDPALVLDGEGTTESGRAAVEHMFVRDHLPTAFFCVNDATALGVFIALSARGYELPRDFSVMGFDDISLASFVTPSLTTMKQPRLNIGEAAMELLLTLLEDKKPHSREMLLRSELIVRNSVRTITSV
ncbi:LacI family DNA-binding transcriptional regulator [Mariluticola halotolerans]|uniref:LacI family DNA-binding transcriptional regulator n=1 Tax=Mariluticola halotolerans TaxID=2909283 RepID=UPI0026E3B9D3|nr:LacI family DNA-binding transcriptional regulator [Mariluticola halotolerans]UJQ93575.1 LacI family transcriptional regulator [Mariluticola halotolerans]